jgi:ribose-phosphate pyrophosphokinase
VIEVDFFSDGEICTTVKPNVRDKFAFLFWDFTPKDFDGDINVRIQELETALGALRHNGVGNIILVCPYLPYSRQERPMRRQPLSAKDLAKKLERFKKIEYLVTFDLHAPQIAGFYDDIKVINVPGHAIFAPFFRERFSNEIASGELSILATDVGGSKRARDCAEKTDPNLDIAIIDKRRRDGVTQPLKIVGDTSRVMIAYDDIGGTMGTLLGAGKLALEEGAQQIYGAVTHNVFCPKRVEVERKKKPGTKRKEVSAESLIKASGIPVFTLDTLPRGKRYYERHPYIVPVPYHRFMADLFEQLISVDGSVSNAINNAPQTESRNEKN